MVVNAGGALKRGIQAAKSARSRRLCHRKIDAVYQNNEALRNYARGISKDQVSALEAFWRELGLRPATKWHVAYGFPESELDPRWIPEDLFYTWVEPRLNRLDLAQAYSDKNAYDRLLPDLRTPEAVLRRISGRYYRADYDPLDAAQAVESVAACKGEGLIIKPSLYSGGGKQIGVIDNRYDTVGKLADLFADYGRDFVVQRRIDQHAGTAAFHPPSVNTLRPMTLRVAGHIRLASCVFRTGNNNSRVDNQSAGGIACQVDAQGRLKPRGMDKNLHAYEAHPATGEPFGGQLPSVPEAIAMVLSAHARLPHFDLVSWDVAIGREGEPILVELNIIDQEINFHQAGGVPILGEDTGDLLRELAQRPSTMSLSLW